MKMYHKGQFLPTYDILMEGTYGKLALYGYLKNGVYIRDIKHIYKFVGFTFDTLGQKETILYVMFDVKRGKYVVKKEKDVKDRFIKLIDYNEEKRNNGNENS